MHQPVAAQTRTSSTEQIASNLQAGARRASRRLQARARVSGPSATGAPGVGLANSNARKSHHRSAVFLVRRGIVQALERLATALR
jgi:hypothetical protein